MEEIIEDFPEPTRVYIEPGKLAPLSKHLTKKQATILRKQRRKLAKRMGAPDYVPSKTVMKTLTRFERLRPDQQQKLIRLKQEIAEQSEEEARARIRAEIETKTPVRPMSARWQVPTELREDRGIVAAIQKGTIYELLESVLSLIHI